MLLDDGSPDPTPMQQAATELGAGYTRFSTNRGISASWNALACHAFNQGADIAVILNDDILVNDNWLIAMLSFLEQNPHAGVASWPFFWFQKEDVPAILADRETGPVRNYTGELKSELRHPSWEYERPGRLGAPAGCCFAVTRECFTAVKGFNENMKSFFEEILFGYQAMLQGFQPYQINGPFLWHGWSRTFQTNPELMASTRHRDSREIFWNTLGVPPNERDPKSPFTWAERTIYQPAPNKPLKWWTPTGMREDPK
jgi:GT2 family glycosyltransferase